MEPVHRLGQGQAVRADPARAVHGHYVGAGVGHGQGVAECGSDENAVVPVLPQPDYGDLDGGACGLHVGQPWTRTAAAPPMTADAATWPVVRGSRMGSPGYAWQDTISRPRRDSKASGVSITVSSFGAQGWR